MRIDMHCHYTLTHRGADGGRAGADAAPKERFSFEPAGGADGPALDSFIAPALRNRPFWRLLKRVLRLPLRPSHGGAFDVALEALFRAHLFAPGPIERFVLLSYDAYHDDDGRCAPPAESYFRRGSDLYTSNSMVRGLCRRHPERFLFGASVHPYRSRAPQLVEEVFAGGACLLKWIPLNQNIRPDDPRTVAVLETCARLGLPLLIHASGEFTLRTQHARWRPVSHWLAVLRALRQRERMPPVIIAHVATPSLPWQERRELAGFVAALRGEFRDAPLMADVSALTAWSKLGFLRRFAREQDLHGKLLFGSDFPVPLARPMVDWRLSPGGRAALRATRSWPQQGAIVLQDVGYNEIVFTRAATWLPNVSHFAPA